jgi:hypothetical protein
VTITVAQGVTIASFAANPTTINAGQSSTLSWTTQGANTAFISGVGPVQTNGSVQVSPAATTTYTLTVTGPGGVIVTKQATVTVNSATGPGTPPTIVIAGGPHIFTKQSQIVLDASGTTNAGGGKLTFQWSGPANLTITNGNTATPSLTPGFYSDYTVTLTVTNSQGVSSTATVLVSFLPPDSTRIP